MAVWSAEPNKEFEQLLMSCGFHVRRFVIPRGSKAWSRLYGFSEDKPRWRASAPATQGRQRHRGQVDLPPVKRTPGYGMPMAQAIRESLPGAFYHLTSWGNERKEIFRKVKDIEKSFSLIGETTKVIK